MPHHAAAIEHQGLQALFGELLGGPSATHAGADYDRVKRIRFHALLTASPATCKTGIAVPACRPERTLWTTCAFFWFRFTSTSLILVAIFSVLLTFVQRRRTLRADRATVPADLGAEVLLRADRAPGRWRDRTTGHVHGHAEPLRDPSVGAARHHHRGYERCAWRSAALPAWVLAAVLLALLPAAIAVLGFGEPFYQAVNPVTLLRVVRGLGPYYLLILRSIPVYLANTWLLGDSASGTSVRARGRPALRALVLQPHRRLSCSCAASSSASSRAAAPSAAASREEAERVKLRARMVDDVFQQVRIGKHVDATRPLAHWLRDLDGPTAARDAQLRRRPGARLGQHRRPQHHRQHADPAPAARRPAGRGARGFRTSAHALAHVDRGFARRPAHARRVRRKRGPRGTGDLDAPGNTGFHRFQP